jgi:hypothetical protein
MVPMATVQVYLVVDADGDYGVGRDEDKAAESYRDDINDAYCGPMRSICLELEVEPAVVEVLTASIPAGARGKISLVVK